MKVLVTGAAGFIGYHVAQRLLESGQCEVLGVDNLNDYYSVELKKARLSRLEEKTDFRFLKLDFSDGAAFTGIYKSFKPDYVVHLGAQAGVRYSLENPHAYAQSNLIGFLNVLEACRANPPKHLVFASSSSIYGASGKTPFSEDQMTDQPVSFYGATKKSNELMAYSYSHLFNLRSTGLRFFTVYGPWGRPDMTPIIFAKAILAGKPLKLFNYGKPLRDFTYVDDIVDGILKLLLYPPAQLPKPPFAVYNIGNHRPVEMLFFVRLMESVLGKRAEVELLPPQPGDMAETCASLDRIHAAVGFEPKVPLEEGLRRFAEWFKEFQHLV